MLKERIVKTRPGVEQCQAQGLVFCPLKDYSLLKSSFFLVLVGLHYEMGP